jgi:hypothetical protein
MPPFTHATPPGNLRSRRLRRHWAGTARARLRHRPAGHDDQQPGDRTPAQRPHRRAAKHEQQRRAGEHGQLPPLPQRAGERDRRAEDRADGRGPGAVEERARAAVVAQAAEALPPSAIARNEGANAIPAASSAPPSPAAAQPTSATVWVTGPGVSCPNATAFRNSASVIQPWRSTASSCISGMITKPPP